MSQKNNYQNKDNEAFETIKRLLSEPSEEAFLEDARIIDKVIASEMEQRERNTYAKAPNIKSLRAAKSFEDLVKKHFKNVKSFERFYCDASETVNYDVIFPRLLLVNHSSTDIVKQFAEILQEAECIDISIEKENLEMKEMIYLDISFPIVIRVYKDTHKT